MDMTIDSTSAAGELNTFLDHRPDRPGNRDGTDDDNFASGQQLLGL
jgi:hypothetical protein